MKSERLVKLIKKGKRKVREPQVKVEPAANPNRWSREVQSWVSEFQKHRRSESLPDNLFKWQFLRSEKENRKQPSPSGNY